MGSSLTASDIEGIKSLYENRFREFGRSVKTVGWGAVEDQILRFDVLCRGLDISGCSVLDVGCGLGDLVPFLDQKTSGNYDYTGIDISEALVESAAGAFAGERRSFLTSDIFQIPSDKKFDFTFLSGALNFRIKDNKSHANDVIKKMFDLSTKAVSFNMLSSYADYVAEKNFHHSPEEIFSYSKKLSPRVNLFHDYPLYEFSVQIFQNS